MCTLVFAFIDLRVNVELDSIDKWLGGKVIAVARSLRCHNFRSPPYLSAAKNKNAGVCRRVFDYVATVKTRRNPNYFFFVAVACLAIILSLILS